MATLTRPRLYLPTVNQEDNPGGGNVQPLSSQDVHDRFLVDAHLTFGSGVYAPAGQAQYLGGIAAMSCRVVRSEFQDNLSQINSAITYARAHGLQYLWLPVPEAASSPTNQTIAETTRRVNWIADNAADVTWGIESLNEPNQNRGDGQTTPGWQNVAKAHQVAIWNAVQAKPSLAGIKLVGSSLNVRNFTTNIKLLGDTGIAAYMTHVGLHTYPGGWEPTRNLDGRLRDIEAAFGRFDPATGLYGTTNPVAVWCTETGYTNAVANLNQHNPASELAVGYYAPQMLLEMCAFRKMGCSWYEALDDADPGAKDVTESNFGLWGFPYRAKPAVVSLTTMLTKLDDPGATYTPGRVNVDVDLASNTDVKWTVTRKRAGGVATVWLYRAVIAYQTNGNNPATRHDITVPTVPVVVTDSVGPRTVQVGAAPVSIDLR